MGYQNNVLIEKITITHRGGDSSIIVNSECSIKSGHKLINCHHHHGKKIKNLINSDFHNQKFSGDDFSFADLTNSDLSNSIFTDVDLSYVTFANTNFSNTTFTDVDFSFADLSHTDLSNLDLSYSKLYHATIDGANLNGTIMSYVDKNGNYFEVKNLPISKRESIERGAIWYQ